MLSKPCAECPFSRKCKPNALGGADATVYIGQAAGPFLLPCHMGDGYEENRASPDNLQCAGAAIYRTNVGVAKKMPRAIVTLGEDTNTVFASPAELLAHHEEITVDEAERQLKATPVEVLLRREMHDPNVIVHSKGKP